MANTLTVTPITITCTALTAPNGPAGPINIVYNGSKSGQNGQGAAWANGDMLNFDIAQNSCLDTEYGVMLILVANYWAKHATMNAPSNIVGHSVTIDLTAASPLTFN